MSNSDRGMDIERNHDEEEMGRSLNVAFDEGPLSAHNTTYTPDQTTDSSTGNQHRRVSGENREPEAESYQAQQNYTAPSESNSTGYGTIEPNEEKQQHNVIINNNDFKEKHQESSPLIAHRGGYHEMMDESGGGRGVSYQDEAEDEDDFDEYEKRNKKRFRRWMNRLHIKQVDWKKAYHWAGLVKTVVLVLVMVIAMFLFCWYPSLPESQDPIENVVAVNNKHNQHVYIIGDPGNSGIVFLRVDTQRDETENMTLTLQYLYSSTFEPPAHHDGEYDDDDNDGNDEQRNALDNKKMFKFMKRNGNSRRSFFAIQNDKNDLVNNTDSEKEQWRDYSSHLWVLKEFPQENGVEYAFNSPPASYEEFLKRNKTVDDRLLSSRLFHKNYRYTNIVKPLPVSSVNQDNDENNANVGEDKNEKKQLFLRVQVETTRERPLPVEVIGIARPSAAKQKVLFAALTLGGVYILIVFELIHRTIAAMLGAFFAMSLLAILDRRPTIEEMTSWVEYETIFLLFGMMVMVGIFSTTGFFEWCAIKAYRISKGKIMRLTFILCTFTAVISAFLDNVTTILLFVPVTIRLCKVLDISPIPLLIAEVVFSNIGGAATAVGDPPIVIIVSNSLLSHRGINFANISLRLAPGAILCCLLTYLLIRVLQRKVFRQKANVSPARMNIKEELEIWKNTYRKMRTNVPEEQHVREMLKDHILELEAQLQQMDEPSGMANIKQLEEQYRITNWPLFVSCSTILVSIILLFFLQSIVDVRMNLAWISLVGAITMMLVSRVHDIEEVLEKVEWGTLLFFAGLFILMKALEELGLIGFIGEHTADLIQQIDNESARLAFALFLLLWVSALASAFIDNIPYTTAMIPVVVTLSEGTNLPIKPLVWALGFGTCLGGNGTLIGASANVVCSGLAEQQGYPISFNKFFKTGFPVMICTVFVANIYLWIVHSWWKVDVTTKQ